MGLAKIQVSNALFRIVRAQGLPYFPFTDWAGCLSISLLPNLPGIGDGMGRIAETE